MAHSLDRIYLHIVFSTKYHTPWIVPEIQRRLWGYMAGILENRDFPVEIIGGIEDHVHILCRLSRTQPVSKLVEILKKDSSKWVKTLGPKFSDFHWQNGYAVFSVSRWDVQKIRNYIRNQREHHRKQNFKKELRWLLRRHGIDFDEQFLWD